MCGGEREPISPELVLVMAVDEAQRVREALPDVVLYDPGVERRAAAEAERAAGAEPPAEAESSTAEAERAAEAETERVAAPVVGRGVAEARRAAAAEAGRVAATEAGRVAVVEARRVALAEARRVALAEAQRVAVAEVERTAAAERLVGRERAAAQRAEAVRAGVGWTSEAERTAEAEPAGTETKPSFELIESSIRPSVPSPPAQQSGPDDEWSYPSRRPTVRSSLVALALGAVAFGGGMLVQKTFVNDETTRVARIGPPEANASATLPAPATPVIGQGKASKPRSSSRPDTEARHAPTSVRSKQGKLSGIGFVPARVWAWIPRPGARSYLVRFFLNNRQVFSGRTHKVQLVLPHGFHYHAGRYRWLVTAIPHLVQPIVDSTFVLSARSAGAANR